MKKILVTTLMSSMVLYASIAQADTNSKPLSSFLQGKFTGSIGAVTDYKYRGISQTTESPAIQGNIDFNHNSGVKLGVWGSNVDFGGTSDATAEFDLYASYTKSFDKLTLEGGIMHYLYPGAKSSNHYDFNEFYFNAGYDFGITSITASINYSPDFFGGSGSAYYPKLYAKVPLPNNFAIDGSVGHQSIDNNIKYGVPDYTDWSVGLSYTVEDFTLKAQYVGTDVSNQKCALDACKDKIVLSLSKSF